VNVEISVSCKTLLKFMRVIRENNTDISLKLKLKLLRERKSVRIHE